MSACGSEPEELPEVQSSIVDEVVDVSTENVIENDSAVIYNVFENHAPELYSSPYRFETIEGANGWGYQIFEGNTMLINQEHIPSVPGINGFSSEEKATKAVEYIVTQMDQGLFPPTVSPQILDSLGVL